ncbi:MAG: sialate O-acetylesterase [Sphingobacteriaceae bacterium]
MKSTLNKFSFGILFLGLNAMCFSAFANVALPRFVSDGMVLQRNVKIPVWGWADPGEKVQIEFKGKTYKTAAGGDGKWMLNLASTPAGGPFELKIKGNNEITLHNILIGDVWVCSGQSNMEFNMGSVRDKYAAEIASSTNPNIRQFLVTKKTSFQPLDTVGVAKWEEASPVTLPAFTAVGYFFARDLYEKYKVPIGLIHTSWGGTPAEAWTSIEGLQPFPKYTERANKLSTAAKTNGANDPTALYNGMIAPLLPYAIKGAIWYQGESNAGLAFEYRKLFPAMITDWRSKWKQGDFPFLFVQLANFMEPVSQPAGSDWAELREAQSMTLSLKNTGMAVITDVGEEKDIHPKNKQDVGKRLALAAEKVAYKEKNIVYSGPVFKSSSLSGNKMILKFSDVGSGMIAKGGGELKQFAIAGEDKKFVWADAKIVGNTIIVSSDEVTNPVAVRYAWANNPEGANLYNKEGLPASAFRTDNWPGLTVGR